MNLDKKDAKGLCIGKLFFADTSLDTLNQSPLSTFERKVRISLEILKKNWTIL